MYKKISLIYNDEDVLDVQDELMDRFGEIPDEVNELINIAVIRSYCVKLGICSIKENDRAFIMKYHKGAYADVNKMRMANAALSGKLVFSTRGQPSVQFIPDSGRISFSKIPKLLAFLKYLTNEI